MSKQLLLLLTFFCSLTFSLTAQTLDKKFASTNSTVYATAQKGDTLYVGGSFTQVGNAAKRLARILPGTVRPDMNFPELGTGTCYAIEPDGNGGYYLGGYFDSFNGTPIATTFVLHILSNGTRDTSFAGFSDGNSGAVALKKRGNRLYVGGYFTTINGTNRPDLAALNATTGALDNSWVPDLPDNVITKIDATDSLVFISGSFSSIGDVTTPYGFATLKASSGKLVQNFPAGNGSITGMLAENNTLYLGGSISRVCNVTYGLGKLDTISGTQDMDHPSTNGVVFAILPDDAGGYYIAGSFSKVRNLTRNNVAHLLADGSVDAAFTADVNSTVYTLAKDASNLYLGGDFGQINGATRNRAGSVSLTTGAISSFNPNLDNSVLTIAVYGSTVYLGGLFTTIKGTNRNYAAAISTANVVASWNPSPNSYVTKILLNSNGTSAFISGYFYTVKSFSYPYLAKVNTTNGNPAAWLPNPNSWVSNMILSGSTLYLRGTFTTINNVARQYFAAIDTASNNPTSLRADLDSYSGIYFSNDISLDNGKLYLAGQFSTCADSARTDLARIDLATGKVDDWNAGNTILPTNGVWAISSFSGKVIIGGNFDLLGYADRSSICAVNLANGNYRIKSWRPNPGSYINGYVYSILHNGSDILAGGSFSYDTTTTADPKGVTMYHIISLNDVTGKISHQFTQYPDAYISSMALFDNKLMVQGAFGNFNHLNGSSTSPRRYLAGYNLANYQLSQNVYDPNSLLSGMFTDASGNLITAGSFTLYNYVDRNYLAAINITTGQPIAWRADANSYVTCLALRDTTLYAGGYFNIIGIDNASRTQFGAVSTNTGRATALTANADNTIYAMAIQGNTLYIGGAFSNIKSTPRTYGAALSLSTGNVTSWAPEPDGNIYSILPVNNSVYIGGPFSNVKGAARPYIAQCNTTNGASLPWSPTPDGTVNNIALAGRTMFIGGNFSSFGSKTRNGLAAVDTGTNAVTGFDCKLNNNSTYAFVNSVVNWGSKLYLGTNNVSSIKTTPRGNLSGVDTSTKTATAFNPMPDASMDLNSLLIGRNKLFAGSGFTKLDNMASPSYLAVFTLEPQTPSTNLVFSNLLKSSVTATWTSGSGEKRAVVVKGAGVPTNPTDGSSYTGNSQFKAGQATGLNSYVVYSGTGNTVDVTGLLPNHSYTFAIVEYNGDGSGTDYLTDTVLRGTILTPCENYNLSITPSKPLPLCPGDSVVLTAPAGFVSYLWSNTSTNQSIKVKTAGNYTVTFTDSNSCTGNAAIAVSFKPVTAPTISPSSLAFCQGDSGTLTASSGYTNYVWNTAATTAAITVKTAGIYNVTATQTSTGCRVKSANDTVTVFSLPQPGVTPSGPIDLCNGSSTNLTATAGYVAYLWNNSQTTQQISVNSAGSYSLTVTDNNNCKGTSNTVVVNIIFPPATPDTIIGPQFNVCGLQRTYSTSAVTGATSYAWTIPASCKIINGQGTTTLRVSYPTNFHSGYIKVAAVNSCGSSSKDSLLVYGKPQAPSIITGPGKVTANQTAVTFSIHKIAGLTYAWTVPAGATITSGQGTDTIRVNWGTSGGTVSVTASNSCGTSAARTKSVSIKTSFDIVVARPIIDEEIGNELSVFPNPAQSQCTVSFKTQAAGRYELQLQDVTGKVLKHRSNLAISGVNRTVLPLSSLAGGVYLITLTTSEGEKKTLRVVKQ